MSTTLMQASRQWASRPADERFLSLPDMLAMMEQVRANSRSVVVSSRAINLEPTEDAKGLVVTGPNGHAYSPTHFSFGQLAQLAEAPAGYLRTLHPALAADNMNYKLQTRGVEDVGVLLYKDGTPILRAATGPAYGRVWNADLIRAMIAHVGDGINGQWRVPGEFGQRVEITKDNTTLYASDRDMFVFLADEDNKIEMANRRDGKPGMLSRGFFLWNSEVGDKTLGIATFLFDYVCANRIVWGAQSVNEIRIRHTAGAPDRWLEEVEPALIAYSQSAAQPVLDTIAAAQASKIDKVEEFLKNRKFGRNVIAAIQSVHQSEEGRPIETLWDASVAVTAYAKAIPQIDRRVEIERVGGEILDMATA